MFSWAEPRALPNSCQELCDGSFVRHCGVACKPGMTTLQTAGAVSFRSRHVARVLDPVIVFLLLSVLCGIPAIFLVPPLRGADETAHVLRAYALSRGEIIPTSTDA